MKEKGNRQELRFLEIKYRRIMGIIMKSNQQI